MSGVEAAAVGAVSNNCLGLLLPPCLERIRAFINLEKNRDSLKKKKDKLQSIESDIETKIKDKNRLSNIHYKKSDTVENLFARLRSFSKEFDGLPERINSIMVVSNYKLTMKVVRLQTEADKLDEEMSKISKDSSRVIDTNSTHSHYQTRFIPHLQHQCHELGILKNNLEERIVQLLSNQSYMKESFIVSSWLRDMYNFGKNVADVVASFQTSGPKLEDKLMADTKEVDHLSKKAEELLQKGKDLLLVEKSLIDLDDDKKYSYYREKIVDRGYLKEECSELSSIKNEVEEKVRERILSEPYMKQSEEVSLWLSDVKKFPGELTTVRDSFEKSEITTARDRLNSIDKVDQLTENIERLLRKGKNLSGQNSLVMVDVDSKYSYYIKRLDYQNEKLENMKKEVDGKVKELRLSQLHSEQSERLYFWLERLNKFFEQVMSIRGSFQQNGCTKSTGDINKVGELLEEARKLKEKHDNIISNEKNLLRTSSFIAELFDMDSSVIFGHDKEFSRALHLIDDYGGKVIAISGMGGIGKTTLLKRINDHYSRRSGGGFDTVAYISVGKEKDAQTIQKWLCEKLLIDQNSGRLRLRLHNYFSNKNSLLLIDDVWDKFKLSDIGIPNYNSGTEETSIGTAKKRKVVIATRSKKICDAMGIDEEKTVKMEWLDSVQSWKLFTSTVGVDETELPQQARDVAEKCGGLPLALVTVAGEMVGKRDPRAWNGIDKLLKQAASASKGMDEVFSALKFSFDRLENDGLREILLYCSLYPQGHDISVEDLTDLLIGEDLIDVRANCYKRGIAQIQSREMIDGLVDANLLIKHTEEFVKLHDCVHKMAVWLTDGTKESSKVQRKLFLRWWLTDEKQHLLADFVHRWRRAKRVSMLSGNDEIFNVASEQDGENPPDPVCQTLLWEMRKIDTIPAYALTSMTNVRVLNLSNSSIEKIDASIGCLIHLRYLNLQRTLIKNLPEEVGKLTQLRQLILRDTSSLEHISRESICRLHNLEKLDMFGSVYIWRGDGSIVGDDREAVDSDITLNDLENLAKKSILSDVSIQCHGEVLPSLVKSDYLFDSLTHLKFHSWQSDVKKPQLYLISKVRDKIQTLILHDLRCFELPANVRFPELSDLSLSHIKEVRVLSNNPFEMLVSLSVANCSEIEDFAWLALARFLRVLKVEKCEKLQTLLPSSSSFSSLKELRLIGCGSLERISDNPLCLPSLESLYVEKCEKLQTLLPSSSSFSSLKELRLIGCGSLARISDNPLCLPSLESLYVKSCANMKKLPFGDEGAAPKLVSIRGSNGWWEKLQWDNKSLKEEFHRHFSQLD